MARSRLADQVGRVVGGRYRLLAPIGAGASADVYVADDVTLRRRVAVKVLHDALAADEGFLRRFRAEARAVASLRHPNVMAVFDWGEEEDGPFLVLEYLGGGSLRDLLDRGHRLSPSQAVAVGLEAAHGLDYAHRRGLVHRDVKPANLLFDDEGRLAIADFGIARALAEATWTEPAGAVVGTVRYASPEQARGNSLDGRADVYAVALVLVEAVTGRVPFAADTTIATLMARLDRPIPVTDELGSLGAVITAAGAVDPEQRVDAAGMVRALEEVARDLPRPAPLPLTPIEQLPLQEAAGDHHTQAFAPVAAPPVVTAPPAGRPPAGPGGPPPGGPPPAGPRPAGPPATAPFPPPAVPAPAEAPPAPVSEDRGPRRRRWPWLAGLVVLVAAAVVAGVFVLRPAITPSYAVPNLAGSAIDGLKAPPHFGLREVSTRALGKPTGHVLSQSPSPGTKAKRGSVITVVYSIGNPLAAVPDLSGMTADQATSTLQAKGFQAGAPLHKYSTLVAGQIIDWQPRGQQPIGSTINLAVSDGPEFVLMPDLVTTPTPAANAVAQLTQLGIAATNITQTQDYSDTVPKGDVIKTDPPAGQQVDRAKTTVTLDISQGPQNVPVPYLLGDSVAEAKQALQAAGLGITVVGNSSGTVVAQQPTAGRKVKVGTTVEVAAF